MGILEGIGAGVLGVLIGFALILARREWLTRRGGTIVMNMRLSTFVPGRGWAPGLGRFTNDELLWYRVFSLGLRPRRVLRRGVQHVTSRRAPEGPERLSMPSGWVVVHCSGPDSAVELAVAEPALTGLLSWMESAPPGARQPA
jgi:hypothetical protein